MKGEKKGRDGMREQVREGKKERERRDGENGLIWIGWREGGGSKGSDKRIQKKLPSKEDNNCKEARTR